MQHLPTCPALILPSRHQLSQTLPIGKISFWTLPKQLFLGEMQSKVLTPSAPETEFHIAQCQSKLCNELFKKCYMVP